EGCFYPPTLFTNVAPSSTIAQVEIFGPVLVAMTFRTPEEAVALANNTPFGLAASVWSENINLALDVAPKVKAGVVWINCTNVFDAAAGFGGYRESGYGREGGREGMWEYLKPNAMEDGRSKMESAVRAGRRMSASKSASNFHLASSIAPAVDRTPKLFIAGKQARPDSGYSIPILNAKGARAGEVGEGNRKDIRNAVEAARAAAPVWARTTGHNRGQILYYIGENLSARSAELAARIRELTGRDGKGEVEATIARLFTYAAWADKWDGQVHQTPIRGVTLAMNEPVGVIGIAAPTEHPLLGFVSVVAPAIATGNTVVAVPSERWPLPVTDFYQVLETSDVPAGILNIVTGRRDDLAKVLGEHDDVDAIWYFGERDGVKSCELASTGNMKQTWCETDGRDWSSAGEGEGREFLRHATQVKNIWIPYGE
ncbi:MAG TPA: aldehyde dehydrogenase family protein, partial [Gemmatimonadaceae bacterium]|nr:aldehyde dehydrogenase family protein [Gemmatimonadaceae bacterium]